MFSQLDSVLLVIDLQEKILRALPHQNELLDKNCLLTEGARILGIPQLFTEQNPDKLGHSAPRLFQGEQAAGFPVQGSIDNPAIVHQKMSFSALGAPGLQQQLEKFACRSVVVTGIETHICIQQSCLDLAAKGYRVGVVADACGSGNSVDHEIALRRMAGQGIEILSVESILMEWTSSAEHPVFREISALLKRSRQVLSIGSKQGI